MQPDLFRISNSKVQTWLRCRKRYWFQYVSGQKWPEETETAGGIIGTAVHRAMRVLGETRQEAIARQELDAYLRMPGRDDTAPGTVHHDRALTLLDRGIAAFQELEEDTLESWVELPPAMRWEAGGLQVGSRIDRADRLADDHFRVVDWKTGRSDDDDATDLQLDIYHVALRDARRLSRETMVTAIAWNLETGRKRVRSLNRDDAASTLRRLQALSQQMTRVRTFEATPNAFCPYCPWLPRCEEGTSAGFVPIGGIANADIAMDEPDE